MEKGFWEKLKKPIIGLAPMDGVTDAAFRFMTAKYSQPSVVYTEFTAAEGIEAGALRLMRDFLYSEIERPVVAQVFGSHPGAFYKTAIAVAALGFNGMDINMGCPAKNIAEQGSGASLIRTPELAKDIARASLSGLNDWVKGMKLEQSGLPPAIIDYIYTEWKRKNFTPPRVVLPLTIKTRIGYDSIVIKEWLKHLLEVKPVAVAIHGRTLKQMYTGDANWEAIGEAVEVAKGSGTMIFGNGDVKNLADAHKRVEQYRVDGVLIGRAAQGNPWIFSNHHPTKEEKLQVVLEHTRYFESVITSQYFLNMRKHLAWYCSGFDGAKELRMKLMTTKSVKEVEDIIKIA